MSHEVVDTEFKVAEAVEESQETPGMSRFAKVLFAILSASILYLSGEILFRRWFNGQVPTQLSTVFVYGLLLTNIVVLGVLWQRNRKNASSL